MRQVQDQKQEAQGCQRQGERPQRPGDPGGSAMVYSIVSSILLPCLFRHHPTLQDYRLPSVTATVTRSSARAVGYG